MRLVLVVTFAALISGCANTPTSVVRPVASQLTSAYVAAIADAQFPRPSRRSTDLTALVPSNANLHWDAQGRVLMATWTRMQFYSGEHERRPGDSFPLHGESWFTAVPAMRNFCRKNGLTGETLDRRLEQRLGLPPFGTYDAFLQVWVHPSDLFRPCADREITDDRCGFGPPLVADPAGDDVVWKCSSSHPGEASDAGTQHAAWMCTTWINRYGDSIRSRNYPWTALGYAYDWGSASHL